MSEMKQILDCLMQINKRLDRIEARLDRLEERMDKVEAYLYQVDEKLNALEQRFDEKLIALEQRFEEKLSLWEFGLETEIQKVYEIVLVNQTNIELLMAREYSFSVDVLARQQVDGLEDRVDVVETMMKSHSDEIRKIQNVIA